LTQAFQPSVTLDLGGPTAQIRIAPLAHAKGRPRGFLVAHSGCAEVDPYHEMFFLPTDTLKLSAFDAAGRRLWRRDLGPGMVPGIWFCPVLAYDLDGDGLDEVWVVNNADPAHALNWRAFQLERMDANDMLYAFDASRDYDPAPKIESIKAPLM